MNLSQNYLKNVSIIFYCYTDMKHFDWCINGKMGPKFPTHGTATQWFMCNFFQIKRLWRRARGNLILCIISLWSWPCLYFICPLLCIVAVIHIQILLKKQNRKSLFDAKNWRLLYCIRYFTTHLYIKHASTRSSITYFLALNIWQCRNTLLFTPQNESDYRAQLF